MTTFDLPWALSSSVSFDWELISHFLFFALWTINGVFQDCSRDLYFSYTFPSCQAQYLIYIISILPSPYWCVCYPCIEHCLIDSCFVIKGQSISMCYVSPWRISSLMTSEDAYFLVPCHLHSWQLCHLLFSLPSFIFKLISNLSSDII